MNFALSYFIGFSVFLIGLYIGSILNKIIRLLPQLIYAEFETEVQPNDRNRNLFGIEFLFKSKSCCNSCKKKFHFSEKIPMLGWLWFKGKCRNCGSKISIRFLFIEIITGFLTFFAVYSFGLRIEGLLIAILLWALLVISVIDINERLIPDKIIYPILWLGLLSNSFGLFTSLHNSVVGAILGYVILWLIFHIFKAFTSKDGIGFGDLKLLALLGAWLGWQFLPLIILLSSISGVVFGIFIMFMKKRKDTYFAFGPFLSVSGVCAIFWGREIIELYSQYFQLI